MYKGLELLNLGRISGMEIEAVGEDKRYRMQMPNTGKQEIALYINSNPNIMEACVFKNWIIFQTNNYKVRIYADEITICTTEGITTGVKAFGEEVLVQKWSCGRLLEKTWYK